MRTFTSKEGWCCCWDFVQPVGFRAWAGAATWPGYLAHLCHLDHSTPHIFACTTPRLHTPPTGASRRPQLLRPSSLWPVPASWASRLPGVLSITGYCSVTAKDILVRNPPLLQNRNTQKLGFSDMQLQILFGWHGSKNEKTAADLIINCRWDRPAFARWTVLWIFRLLKKSLTHWKKTEKMKAGKEFQRSEEWSLSLE